MSCALVKNKNHAITQMFGKISRTEITMISAASPMSFSRLSQQNGHILNGQIGRLTKRNVNRTTKTNNNSEKRENMDLTEENTSRKTSVHLPCTTTTNTKMGVSLTLLYIPRLKFIPDTINYSLLKRMHYMYFF